VRLPTISANFGLLRILAWILGWDMFPPETACGSKQGFAVLVFIVIRPPGRLNAQKVARRSAMPYMFG
ncbi:MAG TPA: hypothetical protein VJ572_03340, partial [Azonexus sp.]|nr:hypothetical protein [Azonexus sp.]